MLVGPSGVTASRVNDSEDRIRADKVPGINRSTIIGRIAYQLAGIDGVDPAISTRRPAVELSLIQVNAFLILGSGTRRRCSGGAGAGRHAVACVLCGRIE